MYNINCPQVHNYQVGSVRVVTDAQGNIEQINHYYPYGGLMGESKDFTLNQPYKYNGKELDRKNGLDTYDYGARHYNGHGTWGNMDELAEKYYDWSPYVYCMGNPLRFIDLDGRKVVIYGDAYLGAYNQLSQSTNLRLSIQNDGSLYARGRAKTSAYQTLLDAINDPNVIVNIEAISSNFTSNGFAIVGAGFMGNQIVDNKVVTYQIVNPKQLEKIDDFYNLPKGVNILHEVIESYMGGKTSPGLGVGELKGELDERYNVYNEVHKEAKKIDRRHIDPDITQESDGFWLNKTVRLPSGKETTVRKLLNDLSNGL